MRDLTGGLFEFGRLQRDLCFLLFRVRQRFAFLADRGKLTLQLLDPLAVRFDGADEAGALGREPRDILIELVEFALARIERGLRLAGAGLRGGLRLRLAILGIAKLARFRVEPAYGALRILDQMTLAPDILADLVEPGGQALRLIFRARFLRLEIVALDGEPVEPGGGLRFALA